MGLPWQSRDARLVEEVRRGRPRAFEALYARHQPAILSFCRHLTGHREDAEDAVQHTFLSAYCQIAESEGALELRPWLFTVARNRCLSLLRARSARGTVALDDACHATDGLAAEVEQRQELRELVGDLSRLPEQQRAALLLAQLDDMSHREIGVVLGVAPAKVKALVFQARSSLASTREARDASCSEIRSQLATSRGAALRRRKLRRHVHECDGCRTFESVVLSQRRDLALLLPVAPSIGLREAILSSVPGRDATALASAGGAAATSAASGGVAGSGGLAGSLAAIGGQGAAKLAVAGVVAVGGTGAIASDHPAGVEHHDSGSRAARAPVRVVALEPIGEAGGQPPEATGRSWPAVLGSTEYAADDGAAGRLGSGPHSADRLDDFGGVEASDLGPAADRPADELATISASVAPLADDHDHPGPGSPSTPAPSAPTPKESPAGAPKGSSPPRGPRNGSHDGSMPPGTSDQGTAAPSTPRRPDGPERTGAPVHDRDQGADGANRGNGSSAGRRADAGTDPKARDNGNGAVRGDGVELRSEAPDRGNANGAGEGGSDGSKARVGSGDTSDRNARPDKLSGGGENGRSDNRHDVGSDARPGGGGGDSARGNGAHDAGRDAGFGDAVRGNEAKANGGNANGGGGSASRGGKR